MCDAAPPRLRVVMPVHNAVEYVGEALDSVLADLPSGGQVVVVDDASTDGSAAVVAERAAGDPRVKVIRHETSKGVSEALNAGIRDAGCPEFVAVAEHDDIVLPGRFTSQLRALADQTELCAVSSEGQYVGPSGRVFGRVAVGPTSAAELARMLQGAEALLIPHPAIMYRRDALLRAGLYDAEFDGAQDLELLNRMVYEHGCSILRLPVRHFLYRLHASATSFSGMSRQRLITRYVRYRNRRQLSGDPWQPYAVWLASHAPSRRTQLRWYRHDKGALCYRMAGLAWLERRFLRFVWLLALSALLHPDWVRGKLGVLRGGTA